MGTGKSAIGRNVAELLDMEFIDSDHAIEQQAGKRVAEIFADHGEPHFRALEREFIERGHAAEGCVVATGGGLVIQPGMKEALRERGVVVCLFASVDTILERTSSNRNRPLLNVENPRERIATLLAEREPIYREAGISIMTDGRPMKDVIDHVIRIYQREAERDKG